ncbi:hypothetical protein CK203_047889 [Vitis vinifera]|uniref:Uncharacterized protein n=1 Tax=Vitis vinifera TaxID=29760 RepID=A0A438GR78_VITVI|nr:hypothetical protein CK203_047889 [Vitis vinifera]
MSLLCMPSSVRQRLEQIQRDFLQGGGNLEREPHLVRWELVCLKGSTGKKEGMVFLGSNGQRVRFWRDRWCGDSPLCVSFPSLFALAVDKEAWVSNICDLLAEGVRGGGALVSQDPLMIGEWRRRKASWAVA